MPSTPPARPSDPHPDPDGAPESKLSLRVAPGNPNHHLWDNNGTWFIHYTVHPDPFTKERVRRSLNTKSLKTAHRLRDSILAGRLAWSDGARRFVEVDPSWKKGT